MNLKAIAGSAALIVSLNAPAIAQDSAGTSAATAPAAEAAALDPERLAAARIAAARLFPDGTFVRMMASTDGMMKSMMGQMDQIPVADFARIGGIPEAELAKLPKASLNEMMAILDPVFEQRMLTMTSVMMKEMGRIMTPIEPGYREGLAQAYAKRFSAGELAEMNRFFATPAGSAYAADSLILMMDPAVMSKMMEFMPIMMKEMPGILKTAEAAMADLPKMKTPAELSPAERKRLAQLMGVPESQLGKGSRK
ncbi:DUF2059 domain-containing protein [Novosphingobium sp. TH158]|uniref:DUF2059 domain-containing protein n=1 Tax=Novosphingobium sp. TH158 TaxID=2067455 RepID=UPI000C7C4D65|nr:DUF2059 domain-containing protein [Novosphingobium sp. TH158]PLK25660.1 hypothetical protein C0V78_01200 [Novosphingobium sp. TH158]